MKKKIKIDPGVLWHLTEEASNIPGALQAVRTRIVSILEGAPPIDDTQPARAAADAKQGSVAAETEKKRPAETKPAVKAAETAWAPKGEDMPAAFSAERKQSAADAPAAPSAEERAAVSPGKHRRRAAAGALYAGTDGSALSAEMGSISAAEKGSISAAKMGGSILPAGSEISASVLQTPIPIPALARGAVLPANKPFLAVVGDQRAGVNVEAPLTTIQEAVALVMADQTEAVTAGMEANLALQQEILDAVRSIRIGDDLIAASGERYYRIKAVAEGGIL